MNGVGRSRMRRRGPRAQALLAGVLAVSPSLVSCDGFREPQRDSQHGATVSDASTAEPVTVLFASSLAPALDRFSALFSAGASAGGETSADADPTAAERLRVGIGGSQQLLLQVTHGAPMTAMVLAGPLDADRLRAANLVVVADAFICNSVVLAVRASAADAPSSAAELGPHRRVVVGADEVPLGFHTAQVVEALTASLGPAWHAGFDAAIVSRERSARATVARLTLGEADAGFVYASDIVASGGRLRALPLPHEQPSRVAYAIVVAEAAQDAATTVQAVRALRSSEWREVLTAQGFVPCD